MPWRMVASGLLLLFILAIALLKIPVVMDFFALLNDALGALERTTQAGTAFVFGYLGTMVPERRSEVVELGMKSIVAGTLATCLIGAVVGLIV